MDKVTKSASTADFSYGERELRLARLSKDDAQTVSKRAEKVSTENRGSDPYNTSGSFDRKKNWSRVGKR